MYRSTAACSSTYLEQPPGALIELLHVRLLLLAGVGSEVTAIYLAGILSVIPCAVGGVEEERDVADWGGVVGRCAGHCDSSNPTKAISLACL